MLQRRYWRVRRPRSDLVENGPQGPSAGRERVTVIADCPGVAVSRAPRSLRPSNRATYPSGSPDQLGSEPPRALEATICGIHAAAERLSAGWVFLL